MGYFAVIDTETNWANQVMSIGVVLADTDTFEGVASRYYILTPEYLTGGMFSDVLFLDSRIQPMIADREAVMEDLNSWLDAACVGSVFAYNAAFDCKLLPELSQFDWYDIMRLAAYRQYNHKIPSTAECCRTGRMKRNYGVEPMLRLLSGNRAYNETHNALFDALDELEIMRLLEHPLQDYIKL